MDNHWRFALLTCHAYNLLSLSHGAHFSCVCWFPCPDITTSLLRCIASIQSFVRIIIMQTLDLSKAIYYHCSLICFGYCVIIYMYNVTKLCIPPNILLKGFYYETAMLSGCRTTTAFISPILFRELRYYHMVMVLFYPVPWSWVPSTGHGILHSNSTFQRSIWLGRTRQTPVRHVHKLANVVVWN